MLFPLERLIDRPDKPDLVCIRQDETIRDTLECMIENEFTQLPVVDKDGDLAGIISEQRIIRSPSPGEGHRLSQETRLLRLLASEEQGNQKALSTPVDEIEWHFSSTGVESAFWFPCSLGYHLPHIDRLK